MSYMAPTSSEIQKAYSKIEIHIEKLKNVKNWVDKSLGKYPTTEEIEHDFHHREKLEKWNDKGEFLKKYLNLGVKNSIHGRHFITCPWTSNNFKEGPDVCGMYKCECRRVSSLIREVNKASMYEHIPSSSTSSSVNCSINCVDCSCNCKNFDKLLDCFRELVLNLVVLLKK